MTAANGYNPLRWNCEVSGCYNAILRPKIEVFADCLPGKIAFTDVDCAVEVNGFFLFLEFKSGMPVELPRGQQIYFERLTRLSPRINVVLACGDARTMAVSHIKIAYKGMFGPWQPIDLEGLRNRISQWSNRVRARSFLRLVAP